MYVKYGDSERDAGFAKIAELLLLQGSKTAATVPPHLSSGVAQAGEGVVNFLATPFRNMSSGLKDYKHLAMLRDHEVSSMAQKMQDAAKAMSPNADPVVTHTIAENIWKKALPAEGVTSPTTQQLLSEAKGRMIGGALQVGIPTVAGGLYLRSKLKKKRQEAKVAAAVNPEVPYNMQKRPHILVITRDGVHHAMPDTELEYSEKVSAPLPKFEGAITGANAALTRTQNMAAPTLNKLRIARGVPTP